MKVDSQEPATRARQAKSSDAERFKKALEEAEPRGEAQPSRRAPTAPPAALQFRPAPALVARATGPVIAPQRGAISSPESLGLKRQAMHAEVQRLGTVRSEAQLQGQERTEHRLQELIARELSRDCRAAAPAPPDTRATPVPLPVDTQRSMPESTGREGALAAAGRASGGSSAAAESVHAATRAEAAMALIERIDVFVKSQRPALSMSVRGHLDATVEVERIGPREVSLRIQGRRGPLAEEDLHRLRDALEARGLKLRALHAQ
ncbi:hypothetical protein [Myxococcus sp. Y35]|uniref:hypothetical protein n=1 Tax=Pseudomyxococcus flavus TaxID=3115648 RepID=UPI003CF82920